MTYSVYVDNVGCVARLGDKKKAISIAHDYYKRAKRGEAGRADPHSFVMNDETNEMVKEYGENAQD